MHTKRFLQSRLKTALIMTSVGLLSVPVAADDAAKVLQHLTERGVDIVESFPAPGNMTGYVGRHNDQPITFYVTPDGEHVVLGPLLDAEGNNLSQASIEERLRGPEHEAAWERIEAGQWDADGSDNAETVLYTFTDPNCPFCRRFREAANPWIEAGEVQLRHVMVGIIQPDSAVTSKVTIPTTPAKTTKPRLRHTNRSWPTTSSCASLGCMPRPAPTTAPAAAALL